MENLLESNERTLIMFDSVCSGLSACLSLVHADIRQMTGYRNRLAQLELEQIQAGFLPAGVLSAEADQSSIRKPSTEVSTQAASKSSKRGKICNSNNKSSLGDGPSSSSSSGCYCCYDNDDPHHLSKLKLLDKELADSFSHALSMSDLQKSSLHAKHKQLSQQRNGRTSIFQVLLGKSSSGANKTLDKKLAKKTAAIREDEAETKLDNKTIIDDINRQTRLAMQYSKQLEAHLFKVEDLRSKYEMHLKMGLVVKSVAKAYLTTDCRRSPKGSSSAGRRSFSNHLGHPHVINDNYSSIGTHSSVSSLNLSTWSSSSRCKAQKCHQDSVNNNNHTRDSIDNNGMYVSTLSLNSKRHKRSSLAKLVQSVKNHGQPASKQPQQHEIEHDFVDQFNANQNWIFSQQQQQQQHSNASSPTSPPPPQNYAYGDWTIPKDHHNSHQLGSVKSGKSGKQSIASGNGGSMYCDDSISRSSTNLNTSQSLLKRNKSKTSQQQQQQLHYRQQVASKTTIKEFIENINMIESEFESYMGSFLLVIEDIQGFARVCQGDVFEINIKYGETQKFKTRISVLKDYEQKCDNRQIVFKARIADVLAIKAYECKGLGKKTLLGHKLCETRDLFTARSQMMTISLNQTGSIKLNLIVTWNPLHLTPSSTSANPGDMIFFTTRYNMSHLFGYTFEQ